MAGAFRRAGEDTRFALVRRHLHAAEGDAARPDPACRGHCAAELQARHGADPAKRKCGDEHRIVFVSPLRRSGAGRDFLGFAEAPMSGSSSTLLRALTPFMGGFNVEFFASMRLVADLGDDDKVEAVVSGGVVDRQFHPHQKDQLPAWSEGRLLPWWFAPQQVEAHAQRRQELVPK